MFGNDLSPSCGEGIKEDTIAFIVNSTTATGGTGSGNRSNKMITITMTIKDEMTVNGKGRLILTDNYDVDDSNSVAASVLGQGRDDDEEKGDKEEVDKDGGGGGESTIPDNQQPL